MAAAWMLELGRTHWRLHADGAGDAPAQQVFADSELAGQAEPIRDALRGSGHGGEPVALALESSWCLSATLPVSRRQELRDRKTMKYRLEEYIPWSAEDCVADYVGVDNQALMVAVPSHPLAELLARLEKVGVLVQSIAPWAFYAVGEHVRRGDWPREHIVALAERGGIDLLKMVDKKPVAWSWLPETDGKLSSELKHFVLESGSPGIVIAYGLDSAAIGKWESCADVQITVPAEADVKSATVLALCTAEKVLLGNADPLIEFKQGPFRGATGNVALRRYSAALQLTAAVLFLVAMIALFHRGERAFRQSQSLAAQQTEVFRELFPNSKVPTGIRSRLESELAKLKGLQGEDVSAERSASAVTLLHRMLLSLPADRRFRLLEIRIEEGRLYLDGEAREHGDAEVIAQRLRGQGFDVPPPRTQRLDDKRVSIRITGTLAAPLKLASRGAN